MKFLFIVQGEGRGHLTQALALEEILLRNGHQVVEVLVGESSSRILPGFFNRTIRAEVKRFISPNFLPAPENKRADIKRSVYWNLMRSPVYLRSIRFIHKRIEESGADIVINFYELLTGLTYLLFRPSVPQIAIGHQYLFLHHEFNFPGCNRVSFRLLNLFTRLTSIGAVSRLALSFRRMEHDSLQSIRVVPPLLRRDLFSLEAKQGEYLLGYMVNSGFAGSIREAHRRNPEIKMHVFWDRSDVPDLYKEDRTLWFHRIDDTEFLRKMVDCRAYATTAGFESVCEAMWLGKPVLMVPAHIEQECNAWDASRYKAGIISDEFDVENLLDFAAKYHPDPDFRVWASGAEFILLNELQRIAESLNSNSFPDQETYIPAMESF